MRIAYADPPYPGQTERHYPDGIEVNLRLLIAHLEDFDGWALSTSSPALAEVLALAPPVARVAAWCRRFVRINPGVSPRYAWEPVIFRSARLAPPGVTDWRATAEPPGSRARVDFVGGKPAAFSYWIFELLGADPGDEFVDVFPGSGAVADAWQRWIREARFHLEHRAEAKGQQLALEGDERC